ncbi:MAG: SEC-C domain-containing protein, partial [Deltaproteobacteria bacterium]|nr:SEC-C domain-containing protein [Deltaproteobacteria bacterium]
AQNFDIRKHLLEYDDVMNKQREVIYSQRREALGGASLRSSIEDMVSEMSKKIADTFSDQEMLPEEWDIKGIRESVYNQFGLRFNIDRKTQEGLTQDQLAGMIFESAMKTYEKKESDFGAEQIRDLERMVVLQVVDNLWKEHLLSMDHLKEGIGLRGYGQQDPLVVYKREGFDMFATMIERIKEETVGFLFRIQITRAEEIARKEKTRQEKISYSHEDEGADSTVRRTKKKVGRNQPCPCGSGKKFKKCCGK